ncbi:putative flavoprotein pyridine nucleotide cytochrome reductase family protein [Lyophyllum shimeji]|uniref:NADH-cytochrome b5 reductase n=1 Tax=Lyophyllum shimeji TaxID=47721 RepID=A0A9P3UTH8_LYOSH|nr:putative flavoprotein pyridine nucleotide cytochrome reductase family protein [Lyophyllum shimeji]
MTSSSRVNLGGSPTHHGHSFVVHFGATMSLLRLAATRSLVCGTRRYATNNGPQATQKKSSNLPYILLGAGVAGLAGYLYWDYSGKSAPKVQEKSPLDPKNFVDFKLKKVIPYNHNTSKFVFELPEDEASLLPVASCVVVKASDPEALKDDKGKPIIRPYTPISPSDQKGELTFLIKRYDNGKMSKHVHNLKEGDTLAIKGPIEKFPYKHNEFDEVALIGGGAGITPLLQLLTHALSDPANKTKFKLLFSNVTEKDILLREEFDALQRKFPGTFEAIYLVDNPEKDWPGYGGYINKDVVKEHVAPPSLGEKVKVFVCGPPGHVEAVAGKKPGMKQGELGGILKELGYTEDQVYKF